METPIGDMTNEQDDHRPPECRRIAAPERSRSRTGRLLDLKAAETYSGISVWTLRDLIARAICRLFGRPDCGGFGLIVRIWIGRSRTWKERGDG